MFHSATTFFKNLDLGQGFKKSSQRHGCARSSVPRLCQVLCATAVSGPLCHGSARSSVPRLGRGVTFSHSFLVYFSRDGYLCDMNWEQYKKRKQWAGELKPSMKRRRIGHDYKSRCIYMITLAVEGRRPLFGTITGDGQLQPATMICNQLGNAVVKALLNIPHFYPAVEIWSPQIMPDHLHAIIFVKEVIPVHLGTIINGFKVACNREYRSLKAAGVIKSDLDALWEHGYNDMILDHKGQLQRMKDYIHDNPRRYAIKRCHPEYFKVRHNIKIEDYTFAAQGNVFLLNTPYLLQVQCSQKLNDEQIKKLCQEFLVKASNGAVLVSPSISPGEKAIMRAAFNNGFPVIILQENGFAPLAKPGGKRFDACAQGKLLMLAPWQHHNDKRKIKRFQCLALNEMARVICDHNRGQAAIQGTK